MGNGNGFNFSGFEVLKQVVPVADYVAQYAVDKSAITLPGYPPRLGDGLH